MRSIWWVRDDLRLHDNPALRAAATDGEVIAVHVDEQIEGVRPPGGATLWWLHHSLRALAGDLRRYGVPLVLAAGDPYDVILSIAGEASVDAVLWNRRYHEPKRTVDARLKSTLHDQNIRAESFNGSLLHEPWTVTTTQDEPFKVYSPFARACHAAHPPRDPSGAPEHLHGPSEGVRAGGHETRTWLREDHLERELARRGWDPTAPDWAGGLREAWTPGERGARGLLAHLDDVLPTYAEDRETPGIDGTSALSPHLRFGEVSPHEIWHRSFDRDGGHGPAAFRSELLWREFAWHRLYHLPDLATRNVRRHFDDFSWRDDSHALGAWQQGRTGIDLVDAGMRQLWTTGWMHNRVRLVVASFLTKNLRLHWRHGEEWFWDTLVDADEASNPFNWQWVAGTGDDAAPYFRVFNPLRQQERFDPDGHYVHRWVPEVDDPTTNRRSPIVDLKASRADALAAFDALRRT